MPGKKPASAAPSRKRTTAKLVGAGRPRRSAPAKMPQVIMMRAIHMPRADLFQHDVAGHLEDEVAPVECAGGETEMRWRTCRRSPRMVRPAKLDVDAVDVGEEIAQHRERQQAQSRSCASPIFRWRRPSALPDLPVMTGAARCGSMS